MARRVSSWMIVGGLAMAAIGPGFAQDATRAGGAPSPQALQSAAPRVQLTDGAARFNGRFQALPVGTSNNPAPVPAGTMVTYPAAPFQQADIVQNLLRMRATSPYPNQFMAGAYNPVYQSVPVQQWTSQPVYPRGYVNGYGWPAGYGYTTIIAPAYGECSR